MVGEIDPLPVIAEKKKDLAERLAASKARRARLAPQESYPPAVKQELDKLRPLAEEARRLNDLNGKMISERMSSNQALLRVLMDAVTQATVYGPDGQTQVIGNGRPRGQA